MLFQALDNKQECYRIYCDGKLVEDYQNNSLTHTWSPSAHFLNEELEYAQIWCLGSTLEDVCPENLKEQWIAVNNKAKVFIKSFYNSKINLNDVCFYDMVPKKFLLEFYEIKNNICLHVFENYKKPKNYSFLKNLTLFLKEVEKRSLNLDFNDVNCADKNNRNIISKTKSKEAKIVYNPWRTVTGRLTTENSSFPILTLKKDLRKIVKPQNDVFLELDFNAAELRVLLALLEQDQPVEDIHAWVCDNVFDNKLTRDQTKKKVFSWLYNPKAKNKKLNEHFDRDSIYEKYYDDCHVYTPFNRKIEVTKEKAVNYLIQSTSSDMLLSSAMNVDKALENKKSFVSFCIHDSIVVDLCFKEREMVQELAEIFSKTKFGTFKTNLSLGKDFGNMKRVL